jgi:hypothetical protein
MKLQRVATFVIPMFLLIGCASQQSSKFQGITSVVDCAVSVKQNGMEVQSKRNGRIDVYELKDAPFRLEVPSVQCTLSVGVFRSFSDFQYVAESRLVLSNSGFSMAGSYDDRDVLFRRSEDPKVSGEWATIYDSVKMEYEGLCKEFGTCPLMIRAFRSYWNFVGDHDGGATSYAEFKRLTMDKQLNGVRGDVSVVVYTKVKDVKDSYGSDLNVMETHPMVLRFR